MNLRALIFLLVFPAFFCDAYSEKKTILVVSRDTQKDSIGYNIVADLAENVNQWINSGQVIVWDGPEKKHQLKKSDIEAVENSSQTRFNSLPTVFIYETWTSSRKKFKFSIKGFSFTGENEKGEEILYGYIDYPVLKPLLSVTLLKVNANASSATTIDAALNNMAFDYAMVYFDGTTFSDFTQSAKIVKASIGTKKHIANKRKIPEIRMVEYSITSGPGPQSENSLALDREIEVFFNQNSQEFFNYGGDRILSFLKKNPIILTDLRVIEKWSIEGKKVVSEPLYMIPFVVGIPTDSIPVKQFDKWGLRCNDVQFSEGLLQRNFYYEIRKVNSTDIEPGLSSSCKEMLEKGMWAGLLKYRVRQN